LLECGVAAGEVWMFSKQAGPVLVADWSHHLYLEASDLSEALDLAEPG
jgi:hypothetical protein